MKTNYPINIDNMVGLAFSSSLTVLYAIFFGASLAHHYFEPGAIHFPLRSIRQSINLNTFTVSERNLSVGKCEQVSDQLLVVNLPNLEISPPPNPYPGFIDSPLVTCLNLASNDIFQIVSGSFDLLPNLRYLDLSKNRMQLCDFFNFGRSHPNLVTLVIEDNKHPPDNINKIIGIADCLPKLRYLYLRRNSIRSLNFSLKQAFPALTHLFLSDNGIDSENFNRDLPLTLTDLYLQRNFISGLDCKILKNLRSIYLDGNIIQSICYQFCGYSSLKLEGVHNLAVLTISDNRINNIESCAFQDTRILATLDLSRNSLEELKRETFDPLGSLRDLSLDDNRLRNVPSLRNNKQLTILSLRRNKLQKIRRESLKNLRALKCLYLGGNQIRSLEVGSLEDLESLEEMDLADNGLDFVPSDWLKWQWNLRILDVRGNKFKSLEQFSLTAAPDLITVYLQNNPVTHINGSVTSKLSPNAVIYLHNDCSGGKSHGLSDCYARCDESEGNAKNATYSRWINNQ